MHSVFDRDLPQDYCPACDDKNTIAVIFLIAGELMPCSAFTTPI